MNGGAQKDAATKAVIDAMPTPPPQEALDENGDPVHYAAGKHLLIDLYRADEATLNDRDGLEKAVTDIISGAGMHLLSVSAHQLEPQGVTVVAGISESHLTIHTWPEFGTALIDLFTCGEGKLLPVLPELVKKFGGTVENARWSLVPRGARGFDDIFKMVLSRQHIGKKRLVQAKSAFQKIDIWHINEIEELAYSSHKKTDSVTDGGTTMLFLDGVVQSSTDDENMYHESLVHPAMAALERGPERVAILGGGEGATLREVLKYKSLKEVVMVELDAEVTDQCRKHMPKMSNCSWTSGTDGQFSSCFDDPRATVVTADASKWFKSHFGDDACKSDAEKFDVIILDLLDPEYLPDFEFAQELYSPAFFKELECALSEDGVLVAQMGEAPLATDLDAALMIKTGILNQLASNFVPGGLFVYNTYIPSFGGEWSFSIGCKSENCASRWMQNAAAVDATLAARLDPRSQAVGQTGFGRLGYYDGGVQQTMHTIPKGWEAMYCTAEFRPAGQAVPKACKAVEELVNSVADHNTMAATSAGSVGASAMADLPSGALLGVSDPTTAMRLSRAAVLKLAAYTKASSSPEHAKMLEWVLQYGHTCGIGGGQIFVSTSSLFSPVEKDCDNHAGVNAQAYSKDDSTVAEWNPVALRHAESLCMAVVTTKDVVRGQGIYLADSAAPEWTAFWGAAGAAALAEYLPKVAKCEMTSE